MTTVTRSDAQANRARVIQAARAVFVEHGRDAEIKEIAERAGVGVGTIYRNFATKDDLVAAITDACIAEAVDELEEAGRASDARARLEQLLHVAWANAERNGTLFSALGIIPGGPGLQMSPPPQIHEQISRVIEDAVASGIIRPGYAPDFVARYIASQFAAYLTLRTTFPAEVVAERLTALVLGAILAPAPLETPDRET